MSNFCVFTKMVCGKTQWVSSMDRYGGYISYLLELEFGKFKDIGTHGSSDLGTQPGSLQEPFLLLFLVQKIWQCRWLSPPSLSLCILLTEHGTKGQNYTSTGTFIDLDGIHSFCLLVYWLSSLLAVARLATSFSSISTNIDHW